MSLFRNVNVVSFYVTKWEQAKQFYREVIGWPIAWASDEVGWEEYGVDNEAHLAINRWDGPEPVPAHKGVTMAVLGVEDAYAVTAELRAKGVKCDDVVSIPGVVTYGTFYDPEGNPIQFVSTAPPPE